MQSEIPKNHKKDDYGWLKCNIDLAKTAAVSAWGNKWSKRWHGRR